MVVKKAVAIDTVAKTVSIKTLKLNAIKASQTTFNTFSGKARAKLNINGDSNDVTLNIRIKSDQKIWISITAIAGIEVARALITPDSILLINRLQNVYVKKPFSYINKFAGSQATYKTLESLIIGNAIPELVSENSDVREENGGTVLSGNFSDFVFKVIFGPDLRPNQTNLSNQGAGQTLQVANSAFIQAGNKVIPSEIDLSSMVKDKKYWLICITLKMTLISRLIFRSAFRRGTGLQSKLTEMYIIQQAI
ncbi:DUF4292 domain-containing protein [Mucilaginibacter gotjawali]|uniref:DUF4292 domain-containing protein n=1 Tax=Mucilaginibacter gotjawali TaxID=1550579 RepID=UPI0012FD0FC6|nr:DUF4292 domain-containing protein [Mucilaginibacter gotjawali]